MSIDLSKLSIQELDVLIVEAVKRRTTLQPRLNDPRPETVQAIVNPQWFVTPHQEGTLLQINHTEYGWLAFMVPVAERIALLTLLLQQSLLSVQAAPAATNAPVAMPAGGGGTLH